MRSLDDGGVSIRLNRSAMTAFADCIVFLTIIMMAVSVTTISSIPEDDDIQPDSVLNMMSSIELRLSDMTNIDDDGLILLPDAMAYSVEHESRIPEYLESLLDSMYGPGMYALSYTFGEKTVTVGRSDEFFRSCATKDASVSVGGYVSMRLEIHK